MGTMLGFREDSTAQWVEVSDTNPLPVGGGASTPLAALLVKASDVTASGNITTQNLVPAGVATANSAIELTTDGKDTIAVQVTGTYTGALSLQGTVNGTNWITLGGNVFQQVTTGALSATITSGTQSIFLAGVGAFTKVRITGLAAMTGTATITIRGVDGNSMVALDGPIPAGSAAIGSVTVASGAVTVSGTATTTPVTPTAYSLTTTASTNGANIKNAAGGLYEVTVSNVTATPIFVKFYNKASAPTVGTDVPILTIAAAANSTVSLQFGATGKRFSTGISIAATGVITAADATNAVALVQISASYL